ncbi:unnamed protein product [Cladocopium goreaui]|uniref:Protein translocase subunit SecA 1 n=1 Tax=Cladocopium goreaui TaxID=2562237 RepID=A0A9P1BTJ9_9DINO|nr:unnamed protein product [Cladocopium goreaui]
MAWQALPSPLQGTCVSGCHLPVAPAKPSHKGPGYDAPVAKVLLAALDRPRRSRGAHVPRRIFESLAELTSSLTEAPEEQLRRRLDGRLQEINGLEARFAELSASQLTAEARALRARAARETLEALLPEAFALVREASKRTWDGLGLDGPGKNGEK